MRTLPISRRVFVGGLLTAPTAVSFLEPKKLSAAEQNKDLEKLFTWGGISAALATGVIGAVGAKIFTAVFADQKEDLGAILSRLLEQFQQIVHAELLQNDRRRLEAVAHGLQVLFHDYLNTPEESLLNGLHTQCALSVSEAQSLGLLGVPSYAILGGLSLSVYQEKYLRNPTEGYRKNLSEAAERLCYGVEAFSQALSNATRARYSDIFCLANDRKICSWKRDGAIAQPWSRDYEEAYDRRLMERDDVFEAAEKDVLGDLLVTRSLWSDIKTKYA